MRPPDENQANPKHPHLRPNLMSSARRGGDEDSILAKLEREPAHRPAAGGSGARLAWYGGAVVIALGLTCTLAWLAAGQEALPGSEVARAGDTARSTVAAQEPAAPAAAVIVDAAPLASAPTVLATADLASHEVPPLRLLKPAPVAQAPVRPTARPPAATELSAALARATAPVAVPARARAPAPRQAARPAKHAVPARIPEAPDSDVALISAVIYHANGHAALEPDAAPARCADDACRPRSTR